MEQTFAEYKEWESTVETHVKESYEKARKKMKDLKPYEQALVGQRVYFVPNAEVPILGRII